MKKKHFYFSIGIGFSVAFTLLYSYAIAQKNQNYGNAPDAFLPFNQFQKPYILFFKEPLPYLGPGRSKAAPTGLTSIKIGFIAPLEGSQEAIYGVEMLKGARLAIEEANKKGYNGIPFQLVTRNDVGLWGAAANELVKLNDEKVWAVVGSIDGNNSHVALRVALKLEMPMVNTGSTDPTLTETNIPWVIRCMSDDRQHNYALAKYVFKDKGISKVAILRANNRYGRVGVAEFNDAARRMGYPIQMHLRYAPAETVFDSQLEKIKKSSAQAVLIWGNDEEAGRIVKRMRELNMHHPVFGSDRMVTAKFLQIAGKSAEGTVASYPYNPVSKDSSYLVFRAKYRSRYNEEPGVFASHAYDGMNILIHSIRKAGLNRAKIRDELTAIRKYNGVTGEIIFDATSNDIGLVWLAEVVDGKFVFKPSK